MRSNLLFFIPLCNYLQLGSIIWPLFIATSLSAGIDIVAQILPVPVKCMYQQLSNDFVYCSLHLPKIWRFLCVSLNHSYFNELLSWLFHTRIWSSRNKDDKVANYHVIYGIQIVCHLLVCPPPIHCTRRMSIIEFKFCEHYHTWSLFEHYHNLQMTVAEWRSISASLSIYDPSICSNLLIDLSMWPNLSIHLATVG